MRQLILHIGQYKTGSTSIQKTLEHARARLTGHGILYPQTGCRKGQHGMLLKGMKREFQRHRPGLFDPAPLMSEITASGCERVIISCEGISGGAITRMEPLLVAHMLERFAQVAAGWDITVVWYYRRQDDALESRMIQTIKGQAAATRCDPADYLKTGEALDYPFFQHVLTEALPQARIVPRCFSRAILKDGDVVRDFCAVVGIDGALRPQDYLQGNVSPSGASVGLQLALNMLIEAGHDVEPIIRTARRMTAREGSEKASILDPETRREVMDFFAEGNARFIRDHVPQAERADVAAHFAAPVSTRQPNVTVSAQTLARAIVEAGAAISFEAPAPRPSQKEGIRH